MKKLYTALTILAVGPWAYMVVKLILDNRVTGLYVRYWDWACGIVVNLFK